MKIFDLPEYHPGCDSIQMVRQALAHPTDSKPLRELARGKKRVLIVSDDIHRPTPVHEFVPAILDELGQAGVDDNKNIEFINGIWHASDHNSSRNGSRAGQ
ncbi:MAG: DUF2088 domain-containing protein [Sedimentisphaerales bacterium]|nr:DUF2088 domain-containing protein [Sedimentisphaerales bacterium]